MKKKSAVGNRVLAAFLATAMVGTYLPAIPAANPELTGGVQPPEAVRPGLDRDPFPDARGALHLQFQARQDPDHTAVPQHLQSHAETGRVIRGGLLQEVEPPRQPEIPVAVSFAMADDELFLISRRHDGHSPLQFRIGQLRSSAMRRSSPEGLTVFGKPTASRICTSFTLSP